ncbi:hypothetical protein JJE66_35605 [Bradyrhizobium diazoefficiens]|uniref:hypothetical protein n=1 Tax=Bradyrhizobium diazoefficiens TaxID=1355477 RepID=UPI00190E1132|nr:hypothetical protein [Bradyrhizobium diazoefficiens]MBK3666526.1 hypothetical protein [Bradyrhizobium diazoefficiens]
MTDTEVAEPVITLLVAVPVPAQRTSACRCLRQSRARLVALLLCVDEIAVVAVQRDLAGNRGINFGAELTSAVLGLDPDLRQLVSQLHVVPHLTTLAYVDMQIATFRLVRFRYAFATTHANDSPQRCNACFIGSVER